MICIRSCITFHAKEHLTCLQCLHLSSLILINVSKEIPAEPVHLFSLLAFWSCLLSVLTDYHLPEKYEKTCMVTFTIYNFGRSSYSCNSNIYFLRQHQYMTCLFLELEFEGYKQTLKWLIYQQCTLKEAKLLFTSVTLIWHIWIIMIHVLFSGFS